MAKKITTKNLADYYTGMGEAFQTLSDHENNRPSGSFRLESYITNHALLVSTSPTLDYKLYGRVVGFGMAYDDWKQEMMDLPGMSNLDRLKTDLLRTPKIKL